jgi:hypothetical protein
MTHNIHPKQEDRTMARRTFYRWADGHTYWKVADGWMGAPTFKDGTPDVESAGYVSDYDLSADEIRALVSYLDRRAAA